MGVFVESVADGANAAPPAILLPVRSTLQMFKKRVRSAMTSGPHIPVICENVDPVGQMTKLTSLLELKVTVQLMAVHGDDADLKICIEHDGTEPAPPTMSAPLRFNLRQVKQRLRDVADIADSVAIVWSGVDPTHQLRRVSSVFGLAA